MTGRNQAEDACGFENVSRTVRRAGGPSADLLADSAAGRTRRAYRAQRRGKTTCFNLITRVYRRFGPDSSGSHRLDGHPPAAINVGNRPHVSEHPPVSEPDGLGQLAVAYDRSGKRGCSDDCSHAEVCPPAWRPPRECVELLETMGLAARRAWVQEPPYGAVSASGDRPARWQLGRRFFWLDGTRRRDEPQGEGELMN